MSWELAGCEDSELITYADRLNRCKESRVMLELELSNEEFKLKHIKKRKQMTKERARTRMAYAIPFSLVAILCVVVFITAVVSLKTEGYSISAPIMMIASAIVALACGLAAVKLWIPEVKMLRKLNAHGKNLNEDNGIVTFDNERKLSEEKIDILKSQIDNLDSEIHQLSTKKKDREIWLRAKLEEEQKAKEAAQENGVSEGAFAIKREEKLSDIQAKELLTQYSEELARCNRRMTSLKLQDLKLQDKIIDIDIQMMDVKHKIVKFVLVVAIVTLVASLFSGGLGHVMGLLWCIVVFPYMLWMIKTCKKPVVEYLVEHEHHQIQDYAFVNSMVPYYKKRKELGSDIADVAYEINKYETSIQEVKNLSDI
ncbi:MAG: hypothetical protein IKL53_11535 [Lachnospiraceae bacterium]|nr:hypothetical protein [Lachnospiraceae bacterium]